MRMSFTLFHGTAPKMMLYSSKDQEAIQMLKMIARTADYLVAQDIIDQNDAAIYRYGMEMLFLTKIQNRQEIQMASLLTFTRNQFGSYKNDFYRKGLLKG